MQLLSYDEGPYRARQWVSYALLVAFVVATGILALYLDRAADARDNARYDSQVHQILQVIDSRLDIYSKLLKSSQASLSQDEAFSSEAFYEYAQDLDLETEYPGARGLGFVQRVPRSQVPAFLDDLQADEGGLTRQIEGTDIQENAFIRALYPRDNMNLSAIGFNMASEHTRREALEYARDTGGLALSGKVILVQEPVDSKQLGFLMFLPLYEEGTTPETLEERREKLVGFVYTPFRTRDLFTSILGDIDPGITFAIYDGPHQDPQKLLYSSAESSGVRAAYSPRFSSSQQIDIGGRTWTILFATTPFFESAIEKSFTPFLFGCGLLVSILLYLFNRAQVEARSEAETSALELQKSQIELRIKNRQITDIFESITDGFAALDEDWIFTYVNREGARMLGFTPAQLIGCSLWETFPDFTTTNFGTALKTSAQEGSAQAVEDYLPTLQAWFSLRCYPSSNGLSMYFQNVTDRKSLEKQKDEFMAIASHELKTPVTSLKAFAQVLHRRFLKAGDLQSAELLGKMNHQINRLTSLIMDLLDVSKVEAGKLILHPEEFVLHDLLQEIMEELQRTTESHRLSLTGDNATLLGDRERIGQVITNLISNAIKYSPEADKIEIHTKRTSGHVQIDVRDFGVGIPKDKLAHIFERFYRVSGPGKETFPGLGLGLYISNEIVRRHEGEISVTSTEGQGSTFRVRLPLKAKTLKKLNS